MGERAPQLVALALPRADLPHALDEVWAAGDAALPLDEALPPARRGELLARLRPHRLLTAAGSTELVGAPPLAHGVAAVVATSGTTGAAKGVELDRAALEAAAELTNAAVGATPGDRWLCCLPPSTVGGLMTLLRSRALGADAVVHARFSPEQVAREERARFVSLVPAMLARLVELEVDLTHFAAILVGGDRADEELVRRARASGANVVTTYGMTETCGGVVYDGVPLPGVDVRLDARGMIEIAGPTLMRGYRLDDDATARAFRGGFFATSDRGELTSEGRLRVLGRVDDIIVTGGNKIAPRAVEDVLAQHPAVLHATVAGVPDRELGLRTVARITVRSGAAAPTLEEVREFVGERLGRHHAPRELVVDELPAP